MTITRRTLAAVMAISLLGSAQISAEPDKFEPIITKSKIEDVAAKCEAKVTVSDAPNYDEDTGAVIEKGMLIVAVQRSNSPQAIACVTSHIPSVVTMVMGREKGIPPLDQDTLDAVLKDCNWQKRDGLVGLVGDEELQFQPDTEADYDRVDCVLNGVRRYAPKFGFVGNEQYRTQEEQK